MSISDGLRFRCQCIGPIPDCHKLPKEEPFEQFPLFPFLDSKEGIQPMVSLLKEVPKKRNDRIGRWKNDGRRLIGLIWKQDLKLEL